MNKNLLYTGMLALAFTTFSCDQKVSENQTTETETKTEDLSATDLINNPNTAEPQVIDNAANAPVMSFGKTSHDFGNIPMTNKVQHAFTFTNTGKSPLIIENASATCGCTVPEWPKEPVAPGKTGTIKVEFDPTGKPGQQAKQVTIRANTNPNITTLNIKANVLDASKGPERPQ